MPSAWELTVVTILGCHEEFKPGVYETPRLMQAWSLAWVSASYPTRSTSTQTTLFRRSSGISELSMVSVGYPLGSWKPWQPCRRESGERRVQTIRRRKAMAQHVDLPKRELTFF